MKYLGYLLISLFFLIPIGGLCFSIGLEASLVVLGTWAILFLILGLGCYLVKRSSN